MSVAFAHAPIKSNLILSLVLAICMVQYKYRLVGLRECLDYFLPRPPSRAATGRIARATGLAAGLVSSVIDAAGS